MMLIHWFKIATQFRPSSKSSILSHFHKALIETLFWNGYIVFYNKIVIQNQIWWCFAIFYLFCGFLVSLYFSDVQILTQYYHILPDNDDNSIIPDLASMIQSENKQIYSSMCHFLIIFCYLCSFSQYISNLHINKL